MTYLRGRVMGIDYGSKRVGVAVSDPSRLITRSVGTFQNNDHLIGRLSELIADEEVVLIVVGMPYSENGGKGQMSREVEEFVERLRRHVAPEIETWDESFSSVDAKQAFIDAGMKRGKRRQKSLVDAMAARLTLQAYLDAHQ